MQTAGSRHFNCPWISKQAAKRERPVFGDFCSDSDGPGAFRRAVFSHPHGAATEFISNPPFTEIIVKEVSTCGTA